MEVISLRALGIRAYAFKQYDTYARYGADSDQFEDGKKRRPSLPDREHRWEAGVAEASPMRWD